MRTPKRMMSQLEMESRVLNWGKSMAGSLEEPLMTSRGRRVEGSREAFTQDQLAKGWRMWRKPSRPQVRVCTDSKTRDSLKEVSIPALTT